MEELLFKDFHPHGFMFWLENFVYVKVILELDNMILIVSDVQKVYLVGFSICCSIYA